MYQIPFNMIDDKMLIDWNSGPNHALMKKQGDTIVISTQTILFFSLCIVVFVG